jgi:hypothetical protein
VLHGKIRELWLDDVKLFCAAELPNDMLMWAHYADQHKGVVLQLNSLPQVDNLLCAAQPVTYQNAPPTLATLDDFVESHFIGKPLRPEDVWDKLFYTKHSKWSYEREWRVVLMGEAKGKDFADMKIRRQEIGGIVFGSKISPSDRAELTEIARELYGHAKLWQATLNYSNYSIMMQPACDQDAHLHRERGPSARLG